MAQTKEQISRELYGKALARLTPGQKANVTRAFNAQEAPTRTSTPVRRTTSAAANMVKFARPGVNGTKEIAAEPGATLEQALAQAQITVNRSKEGVINKDTGANVRFSDLVQDGQTYLIVPGVDSSY